MPEKQILVVRGQYRGIDPNYACAGHDVTPGNYAVITVTDGAVTDRLLTPRAHEAREAVEAAFRGDGSATVFADAREDAGLVPPLELSREPRELDLPDLRRYLNEDELFACRNGTAFTRQLLDEPKVSETTFRAAAQKAGYKAGFATRQSDNFVEYRGGLQDARGRSTFLTRVEGKTDAFRGLLARAEAGLTAVERALMGGRPSMQHLNQVFRGHLHPGDQLFGDVLHQSGYVAVDREAKYQGAPGPDEHAVVGAIVGLAGMRMEDAAAVYRGSAPPAPSPAVEEYKEEYRAAARKDAAAAEAMAELQAALPAHQQALFAEIMAA